MTDCEHCSETFEDDAAYLRHLDAEHPDQMGPIERRRLEEVGGDGGGAPIALIVGALAVGGLIVAIVFYTLTTGGSGSDLGELGPAPSPPGFELGPPGEDEVYQPYRYDGTHDHGTMTVVVAGDSMDFADSKFQHPQTMRQFHFEPEPGEPRWHAHARGVTLEYALEATAFGVTNSSFAYDGVIYRESSDDSAPEGWQVMTDAEIRYRVNGEAVDPETYVLEDDDSVVVHVEAPSDGNGTETGDSETETGDSETETGANETDSNQVASFGSERLGANVNALRSWR